MNANNKTARLVGALFLICNFTFLLGAVGFIEPILGDPDYLNLVYLQRNRVVIGVLLELMNGVAYLGITVVMYTIMRSNFERIAIAYVAFRVMEFVMQVLADLSPLSLLTLGEEFVNVSPTNVSTFEITGSMLLADRAWAFQMISITFGLGALCFYFMLYHSKLIPRFISVWGLIGATVVLLSVISDMFVLNIPDLGLIMLLNELFLAVWLIIKGFSPTAITTPDEVDTHVVSTRVPV